MPSEARQAIDTLDISKTRMAALVKEHEAQQRLLKSARSDADREALKKDLHKQDQARLWKHSSAAPCAPCIRATSCRKCSTWFWFNHFNVFQGKGPVRGPVPDYEEYAIRPHVLGKFRELLLATLKHPAMLVYLDNRQNTRRRHQ